MVHRLPIHPNNRLTSLSSHFDMLGYGKDAKAEHLYVSLKDLANEIMKKVETVEMYAINPKKKGEVIQIAKEEDRLNALMISIGKLAVEATSVKDLLYTARAKQGNTKTKDSAFSSHECKGIASSRSHASEACEG